MVLQLRREEPASGIPACAPEAAQPLLLLTGSPASFQAHHIQTVSAIREFFFFFLVLLGCLGIFPRGFFPRAVSYTLSSARAGGLENPPGNLLNQILLWGN